MKIYDCFTFNDENEILEIRLNQLNSMVDFFVIVESKYNHQGNVKGKKINENILHPFKKKIKYFYLENKINSKNSWELESNQRFEIKNGLNNCKNEDIIIVSDVDEIPKIENINFKKVNDKVIAFRQIHTMYKFNLKRNIPWIGSKLCSYSTLKSPQWLRKLKVHKKYNFFRIDKYFSNTYYKNFEIIDDGGWHFGWLKNSEDIIKKINSYAHTEHNVPLYNDLNYIENSIKKNLNFFDQSEKLNKLNLELLPEAIKNNLAKYKKWII